jgi:hypothetical protein
LDVGKASREAALQVEEEGLGLEPRMESEQFEEFGPDVLERVLPGPPGVRDSSLTGEGSDPNESVPSSGVSLHLHAR